MRNITKTKLVVLILSYNLITLFSKTSVLLDVVPPHFLVPPPVDGQW